MNHINFDCLDDITHSTLFAIPDYQRDYSWGTAEVETLLEDIRELLNRNGINGTQKHFCGSIVVIKFDPTVSKNTQGAFQTLKLKNFEKAATTVDAFPSPDSHQGATQGIGLRRVQVR